MSEDLDNSGLSSELVALAAKIVAAFVSHNAVPVGELTDLIDEVHSALRALSAPESVTAASPEPTATPAVPIKKSITEKYLVCLEDGHRFKSLKRHLGAEHGLSAEAYRAKWKLPHDYPMVAPAYSKARSQLAKDFGLGQKRRSRMKSG
jgi:predicted transcriptional regulator